jgi:hypothetical protein
MTNGLGTLLFAMCVLVLSTIAGIGALLYATSERDVGWHLFNLSMAILVADCVGLFIYFMR